VTEVVLVAGPAGAGVTALCGALRERLPKAVVVEHADDAAVVVLAVSAVSPPADSDLAALDGAATRAGRVVGVVTKIDAHRRWRAVRGELATLYPDIEWIGAAAAPRLGPPDVEALVAALPRTPIRRRPPRPDRSVALRTGLQRERLDAGRYARERCAGLRTEFRGTAAEMTRGSTPVVAQRVRAAADAVLGDVDARVDERLARLALDLGASAPKGVPPVAPEWDGPPASSRRAERGLTVALGAGFGVGIAVAAGRLVTVLAPWPAIVGQSAGAAVGLLLTVWLVSTRELLHDRAVVDRWVCDIAGTLRIHAEDRIASRLLDAEVHFVKQVRKR
jgi:hypothetical protein